VTMTFIRAMLNSFVLFFESVVIILLDSLFVFF